jgi:predicted nucleotidyltransferase
MAPSTDAVIEIIKKYVHELRLHNISVDEAILFGSFVKGTARDESDIDVALISDAFTSDRFDNRRKIIPFRRAIDTRLEPMPFSRESFAEGGALVDDIKGTGIRIAV